MYECVVDQREVTKNINILGNVNRPMLLVLSFPGEDMSSGGWHKSTLWPELA